MDKFYFLAVKTMTVEATTRRRRKGQAGGLALVRKYGREHMRDIGRLGGRPRALTIKDILKSAALASQKNEKEVRHGESLKELLRLWKNKLGEDMAKRKWPGT